MQPNQPAEGMSKQTTSTESIIAPLHKVTPLSKYLALAIFIALPFVGGVVGYVMGQQVIPEQPAATDTVFISNNGSSAGSRDANTDSFVSPDLATDTATAPIHMQAVQYTHEGLSTYECTSVENNYPHVCYSFTGNGGSDQVIANLNTLARAQGVFSERTALQDVKYVTADKKKIYFTAGIPESDACCSLLMFDTHARTFTRVDAYQGLTKSFFSTDARFIATIEDERTILNYDLETEKEVVREVVSEEGSLVSTQCGFAGAGYDVTFNAAENAFRYGIYADETVQGDVCTQVKLRDDFIPL